jgi:hypothetical protein
VKVVNNAGVVGLDLPAGWQPSTALLGVTPDDIRWDTGVWLTSDGGVTPLVLRAVNAEIGLEAYGQPDEAIVSVTSDFVALAMGDGGVQLIMRPPR